jgi:flagellar biosynthetic protein FliP
MSDLGHILEASSRGTSPVDLLIVLFGVSLVPLLAVSITSFTRIVVVLGLLRASLGAPSLPPNAVIMALAIMLSGIIMGPTLGRVQREAATPYFAHRISASQALTSATQEFKSFMLRQTRRSDIATFERFARAQRLDRPDDPRKNSEPPFPIVASAFMVGELRAAFAMGFALALPFAVIDIVVAAVMMSLGMFMVSPASISLPLKLLLFVAADGWTTVCGTLVNSFR